MEGQMTIRDYEASYHHDRYGRKKPCREWMRSERCGTCKHWQMLPTDEQPPCGWGVKGICQTIHDPRQEGYHNTDELSYCDLFEWRI